MRAKDIRAMDEAAKKKELHELLREQFNLRMQNATGQVANTARLRQVRRDIARVRTIISESKRGGAEA
ncbi:MAG: 50S ribosomal protein L29 [Gammaproteobacteria bacterium]|nr:50S ribosomal protein L29 [Gammaproteobacteria bacterium]